MHGKGDGGASQRYGLFAGLPERFRVTRYHSLIVRQDTLPEDYEVDCISEDGAVMGISQKEHMLYGGTISSGSGIDGVWTRIVGKFL